ncbi:MAG: Gfo/Idh/MocA family oxidoreductase [Pseudomonadota bacterium]
MLRAAIVGLGSWGQVLVDSVQADGVPKGDLIRFTRAITRTPANAQAFADRQGLAISKHLEYALGPDIDAVVIASINSVHVEQIVAAATAGKPVFVEKPLAFSVSEATAAAAACAEAGVPLALGHNRRFLAATMAMKQLVAEEAIGKIVHVEGNYSSDYGFECEPGEYWVLRDQHPIGGMSTMGVHILDMMINLVGQVSAVRAVSRRQLLTTEADDTTTLLLDFGNGASGALSTLTITPRHWRVTLFGTRGQIEMNGYKEVTINRGEGEREVLSFPVEDMERAELEAFARAATNREAFPLPIEQAVHNAAVLEAVIKSAAGQGAVQQVSNEGSFKMD